MRSKYKLGCHSHVHPFLSFYTIIVLIFLESFKMHSLSIYIYMCVCVCVCIIFSHVRLFLTPCTVALDTPLSMEFSR